MNEGIKVLISKYDTTNIDECINEFEKEYKFKFPEIYSV